MNPMTGMLLQQAMKAWQTAQHGQAESLCRAVLQMEAGNFDALHMLGLLAAEQGRHVQAVGLIEQALVILPEEPAALLNLASSQRALKRHAEALATLDKALRRAPRMAALHHNQGNVLRELQRFDEALAAFDRAIELAPTDPDCMAARASVLFADGRFADARAAYHEALALQPDHPDALWNLSLLQLLHGELKEAWPGYEAGGRIGTRDLHRHRGLPVWRAGEDLTGKSILVHAEQGLGDSIQFSRYLPLLKAAGARQVVFEVQPPLASWMADLPGVDQVCARGSPLPAVDLCCPLLSLPGLLGTSLETIPACLPMNPPRRASGKVLPQIGLVWAGNPEHVNDSQRSAPFAAIEALIKAGPAVQWHSLQISPPEADCAAMQQCAGLQDAGAAFGCFADTAAFVAELDLVISVDTSVAHLAATLGVPVWLLLPAVPDWRWLLQRDDSPWYPSMRLFRRQRGESWEALLGRVLVPALENWLKGRGG